MKKNLLVSVVMLASVWLVCVSAAVAAAPARPAVPVVRPAVQLAILLDTSGSMDGLIDQAKSQLWKIVNDMARAKKNGSAPQLEVALYEYGKNSIPASEGYLRMIVPLTTDLDRISEELFKLQTNGGSEFCGQVIQQASQGLNWSRKVDDLKMIFIAGNEPFTQGNVDYRQACRDAIARGIIVNTVFCGNFQEGVQTSWKDGADLADGRYLNIDQNQVVAAISAPQDAEIARLNNELNGTYFAFGAEGRKGKERQEAQDRNAAAASPEAAVQRAVAKSSGQYQNATWDLVDAVKAGQVKLEEVKADDLPEEMRKLTLAEQKQYLEKVGRKRAEVQKRVSQLNQEREKYVAAERKKQATDNTLDAAIIKTVREQAAKKNFKFEN